MLSGKIIFIFFLLVPLMLLSTELFAAGYCVDESECDDGVFCNGRERCIPFSPLADDFGCVSPRERACPEKAYCNEIAARCELLCVFDGIRIVDQDGDGHDNILCGGDDCDDNDHNRYPGNPEVCDPDFHDEDCDLTTFGNKDLDNDGFVDATCCNINDEGVTFCGNDCDDLLINVHPLATETCDGMDNDCDGFTDEEVSVNLYPDLDRDGYGDRYFEETRGCPGTPGFSILNNDCDDTNPAITPGVFICNGQQGGGAVLYCSSAGSYEERSCLEGSCVIQPNYLGVCQILPGVTLVEP